MSDETPPKKAWARCPACSTVYPNIQIAKDGHKLNCPHDMQLKIQAQDEKIAGLEEKILALGGNLDEISSEPGIDFTGVEDDEPVQESQYVGDEMPPVPLPVAPENDWDDEDEEPSTVQALR